MCPAVIFSHFHPARSEGVRSGMSARAGHEPTCWHETRREVRICDVGTSRDAGFWDLTSCLESLPGCAAALSLAGMCLILFGAVNVPPTKFLLGVPANL